MAAYNWPDEQLGEIWREGSGRKSGQPYMIRDVFMCSRFTADRLSQEADIHREQSEALRTWQNFMTPSFILLSRGHRSDLEAA